MQQNRPFIYNPGQKIEKSFAKASDGLAEGFQNLIDYKQKGYEQVKSIYDDRDVIMKDVNMFNSQELAKRTNDLLTETSSVIKSNGTIDFQKMGEIKRKVADIKQAKVNSELRVKAAEEVVKMTYANAANMKDPGATVSKLMATLKDPNSLFSPKNGYDEVMNLYKEGVDYATVMSNTLKKTFDRFGTVTRQYTNKEGDRKSVTYKAIPGFQFNTETEMMEPKPEPKADGTLTNPSMDLAKGLLQGEELEYFMRDLGAARVFNGDPYDYINDFVNQSIQGVASTKVEETGAKARKALFDEQTAAAKAIVAQSEATPEALARKQQKENLDLENIKSSIKTREQNANTSAGNLGERIRENNYQINKDATEGANSGISKPGETQFSETGDSFFTDLKYGASSIKGIGNSRKGGITLIDQYGKEIPLDDKPKFDRFYNSLDVKDRKDVDRLRQSPNYTPVKGQVKVQPKVSSSSKVDVSSIFKQ
jgi:hypothetical protein